MNMIDTLMRDASEWTGRQCELAGNLWLIVGVLSETDTHLVVSVIYASGDPNAEITPLHVAHVAKANVIKL